MYSGGTAQRTAASRSFALRRMVEQFADKDKYEFMLLDGSGHVIASTSGTNAEGIIVPDDFEQAQTAPTAMAPPCYTTSTGEPVMAVCCLVPYAAEEIAAMRLVTSLALIRRRSSNAVAGPGGGRGGAVHRGVLGAVFCAQHRGGRWARWSGPPPTSLGASWISACLRPTRPGTSWTGCGASINRMAQGLAETEKMKKRVHLLGVP